MKTITSAFANFWTVAGLMSHLLPKKCSLLMEINVFCCHEPYTHTHTQQKTGDTHRMGAPSRGHSRYSEKSVSACVLPSLHSRSFEMNVWVCVGGWRDNEFPGRLRANR